MRTLLLALVAGCLDAATPANVSPPSASPPPASPSRPQLPEWSGPRSLPMMPESAAALPAYRAAVEAWHTATTAYAAGDAQRSAESFLAAAEKLHGAEEPIARAFAAGRCLAYESAERAWAAGGLWDRAQAGLTALSDAGCQHSIAATLRQLSQDRARQQ